MANAFAKYVRGGALGREEAIRHYQTAVGLVDHFFPTSELAVEALAEGVQHQHAVYDLTYAILARRTGATVLTADGRFARLLEKMQIAVLCPT